MSGMVLSFQKRFVPMVLDGSKTHTIRGERKDERRPKPGDMLHLWTGLRTKSSEFILRAPCLRTEDVEIWVARIGPPIPHVEIAGETLFESEMDALAWRDGFRYHESVVPGCPKYTTDPSGCFREMVKFWRGRLPFRGWITHWDFSKAEFERTPVNHGKDLAKRAKAFTDAFETLGVLVP